LRHGLTMYSRLALNCLSLPSFGIIEMYHNAWLFIQC
jgi:hypothetical protein